ncbi:hypothetical protein AKJ09_05881 [Labilithrix luteola]|uniref:Uncharacterized protein n=1 Tax=Labilithrix luteola TaxID=1391654 RepID=A0A0K1Q0F5_9BACT|nr:hypothetical protein AKJ09_05881 [Labilithrix luteola]
MRLLGSSVAPFLSLALLGAGPLAASCSSSEETSAPCQNVAAADKEAWVIG